VLNWRRSGVEPRARTSRPHGRRCRKAPPGQRQIPRETAGAPRDPRCNKKRGFRPFIIYNAATLSECAAFSEIVPAFSCRATRPLRRSSRSGAPSRSPTPTKTGSRRSPKKEGLSPLHNLQRRNPLGMCNTFCDLPRFSSGWACGAHRPALMDAAQVPGTGSSRAHRSLSPPWID